MKWAIIYIPNTFPNPDMAAFIAQTAEQAGFESIWGGEHVVFPVEYEHVYGFTDSGEFPNTDKPMPDPLIYFAYAAAVTKTLRFGTGVVLLPEHNPLVFAKSAATLDFLSGGRFELGVGIGWMKAEFEALGIPWEQRGKRTDEYIAALRRLWSEDEASFDGEILKFPPVRCSPKPPRKMIPIHIGGDTPAAARRAGRLGDGFFPAVYPNRRVKEELPMLIDTMRRTAAEHGRDGSKVEITSGGTRKAEGVAWFEDLGVSRLTIAIHGREKEEIYRELMTFGDEVISKTR